jgi:hypothetical protein
LIFPLCFQKVEILAQKVEIFVVLYLVSAKSCVRSARKWVERRKEKNRKEKKGILKIDEMANERQRRYKKIVECFFFCKSNGEQNAHLNILLIQTQGQLHSAFSKRYKREGGVRGGAGDQLLAQRGTPLIYDQVVNVRGHMHTPQPQVLGDLAEVASVEQHLVPCSPNSQRMPQKTVLRTGGTPSQLAAQQHDTGSVRGAVEVGVGTHRGPKTRRQSK